MSKGSRDTFATLNAIYVQADEMKCLCVCVCVCVCALMLLNPQNLQQSGCCEKSRKRGSYAE